MSSFTRNSAAIASVALSIAAQEVCGQKEVTGLVSDSLGKPVQWCATGLLDARDSSVVKGTLTDDKGVFVFSAVKPGSYLIRVSSALLGESKHGPYQKDSTSDLRIPAIRIVASSTQLSEVQVTTIKDPLEFSNGNITMNVEGSALAAGNSVLDLLSKMPGVMVENESITIQGKSGAKLYVDERAQPMNGAQLVNFLRSLNAADVEKVEVIVNPPARYDAAGNAGIINIRMKRVKLTGFSGNANLTLSQGFHMKENGGVSLNYKGKAINIFTGLSGHGGITHQENRFDRTISNGGTVRTYRERFLDNYTNEDIVANLGIDWYASKKYTFGARFQGIPGYGKNRVRSKTDVSDPLAGYDRLVSSNDQPNDWYLANYNLNGERKLDTLGSYVRVSGDLYTPYFDNYYGNFNNAFLDSAGNETLAQRNFQTETLESLYIINARVDIHKQLSKDISVDGGIKSNSLTSTTDFNYIPLGNPGSILADPTLNNKFVYKERITAAYASVAAKKGKIDYSAGIRAEKTEIATDADIGDISYKTDYTNIFPQAGIGYSGSGKHRLNFNYNRRIDRPHYNSFNPRRWFNSILTGGQGNPFLSPALSDNYMITYGYGSEMNHSLSFTSITRPIMYYMTQDDATGAIMWRVQNFRRLNIARCNLFFKKQIFKWWTASFLVGAYYIDYSGDVEGGEVFDSKVPHYEWLNTSFLLPKNFKIELTGFYWGPWLGIGYEHQSRGGLNIGVKKMMLDNNLTISLTVNDVFFTEPFRSSSDFRSQQWNRIEMNDSRRLNLSVAYNFGKIKAEQRQVESGEEKSRMAK